MYSKEQFNWVWKDTSREGILNQFYYDHLEMEKYKNIVNELEEFFIYEFNNEVRPLGSYKVSVWTICLDKLKELKEVNNE